MAGWASVPPTGCCEPGDRYPRPEQVNGPAPAGSRIGRRRARVACAPIQGLEQRTPVTAAGQGASRVSPIPSSKLSAWKRNEARSALVPPVSSSTAFPVADGPARAIPTSREISFPGMAAAAKRVTSSSASDRSPEVFQCSRRDCSSVGSRPCADPRLRARRTRRARVRGSSRACPRRERTTRSVRPRRRRAVRRAVAVGARLVAAEGVAGGAERRPRLAARAVAARGFG